MGLILPQFELIGEYSVLEGARAHCEAGRLIITSRFMAPISQATGDQKRRQFPPFGNNRHSVPIKDDKTIRVQIHIDNTRLQITPHAQPLI